MTAHPASTAQRYVRKLPLGCVRGAWRGHVQHTSITFANAMPESEDVPKISVIIPTKNRADDLRCTLEGLIVQTRRPDEIIVVDQSAVPSFGTRKHSENSHLCLCTPHFRSG